MERKVKTEMNVWMLIGIIFTIIGACFSITMAALFLAFIDSDPMTFWLFLPSFGTLGVVFLAIGLILLAGQIQKTARCNKLLNSGNYITAEITEVTQNYNVRVNGRHPYIIKCIYQDRAGNIHIFTSRNLFFDPGALLRSQQVKVYVDGEDFKHYYVDADEILPRVINHK